MAFLRREVAQGALVPLSAPQLLAPVFHLKTLLIGSSLKQQATHGYERTSALTSKYSQNYAMPTSK